MRRIYALVGLIILLVLAANLYYFIDIFKSELNFQKELLTRQVQTCGSTIEGSGLDFENEINYILFSDDIAGLFEKNAAGDICIKKLENFYTKYQGMITNIRIYNMHSNVMNLTRDSKNEFFTDYYTTHQQKELSLKDKVEFENNTFKYYLPVFKDNQVFGNIEVTFDFVGYLNRIFASYHAGNALWQYLVKDTGTIVVQNYATQPIRINNIRELADSVMSGNEGSMMQEVTTSGETKKVLSIYYPIRFMKQDFGVVFSLQTQVIRKLIVNKAIIISTLSLVLLIFLVIYFLHFYEVSKEGGERLQESENTFKKIIEFLPIGIIVVDHGQIIRTINKKAAEILNIRNAADFAGKKLSESLSWSENFVRPDYYDNAFDAEHFINFVQDGQEMVILKKEIPVVLGNEELYIEAFIDITAIEKARKLEAAANNAKSEFLAKMSHEIRTPMNGIIGMADALSLQPLTSEQKDQVTIIQKSADLLLMILNDILDFSKIEAGKMILEEIPFRLREEINIVKELFRPSAQSKNVQIITDIRPNVMNNLLGDPFRLRQILSNLLGNAVKFTHQGKIVLSVEQVEQYSGNITLRFSIADTGIGIPKDKIGLIFSSFSQVDGSTTRKYGGSGLGTTIAKQLVELMNGEISVASPSGISDKPETPGTRFTFTVEVFSNEKLLKAYDFNNITDYTQVRVLIISDRLEPEKNISSVFSNLGIKVTVKAFSKTLIEALAANDPRGSNYEIIVIIDNPYYDGFKIAEKLQSAGISDRHLIILFSSNNKAGNFVRCRKLEVDHYIVQPHEASEVFDIVLNSFPAIRRETELPLQITQIRKNISILLAEDNLINQKVAQTIFKSLGFEIAVANDGNIALKMLAEKNYDIVFMDMMMPEKDGTQATIEIRAKGYTMPVVAMTASVSKEDMERALSIGMNDYIIKPVKVNTIKTILMNYFSENI